MLTDRRGIYFPASSGYQLYMSQILFLTQFIGHELDAFPYSFSLLHDTTSFMLGHDML